jgi:hypothetical protein
MAPAAAQKATIGIKQRIVQKKFMAWFIIKIKPSPFGEG